MAAANTDKFRKKKNLFSTTLSGSITDSDTSLSCASLSGVPTDTAITITIDRVDANSASTPSLREDITGVVSGNNLTNLVRGEGATTAQAHANNAAVELAWETETWNDAVDAILVGHNQDGTHKSGSVLTLPQINDTSSDHQYVFAVNELAADRTVTLPLLTGADEFVFKDHAVTMANKTLTTPVINGAVTGTIVPPLTFYSAGFNAPEGFLLNGKIVPSVASNNLTVAIKGMDGNDPSSSNPVYVKLNGAIRSITSALSVTKNAGTNWFNAGSTELATKEIDYFVYLGYNATDGTVVGFSRIPYASSYDDFSATTTSEKYAAISTITTAAATDYYSVVGRFAATLSAGAGYTWTVPTFTAKNLIQRPIYETRQLTFTPSPTGFTGTPTVNVARYKIFGRSMYVSTVFYGTSNAADCNITLPFAPKVANSVYIAMATPTQNNGTWGNGVVGFLEDSATAKFAAAASTISSNAYGGFTTSGSKAANLLVTLEIESA